MQCKVKTDSDRSLLKCLQIKSGKDFGYDIKQAMNGVKRTVPFLNENMVATVALLSALGIQVLKYGETKAFLHIQLILQMFCKGEMNWSDFVRKVWDVQKTLGISDEFFDDALTHIEGLAGDVINTSGTILGDVSAAYLAIKRRS